MEREIFPALLNDGARFIAHPIRGEFLDIGTPAGYAAAEQFLRSMPQFEAARTYA
jgi:NDP-sugar pyrophosphorylase family protein